jgi:pilus assembly protein Flp/PilA
MFGAGEPAALEQEVQVRRLLARFWSDQSGATAIEYCLLGVGISLAIIISVQALGPTLSDKFSSVNTSIK